MKITTDFPGGNIDILSIENDLIKLKPDFRDTVGDWFYWAFRVTGASRRTLTFDFSPYNYVGCHGPAVSRDLDTWEWAGTRLGPASFAYEFGVCDDDVYFAHDMLYGIDRFNAFAEHAGLKIETLSDGGVPIVRFGEGERTIFLTARHHCCESTGSYVLEGVLDELRVNPIPGCRVFAVPFVDYKGVAAGDQGKNRAPYDHNRDYCETPIYDETAAIMDAVSRENVTLAFDFHSPWHSGGRNDHVFFMRARHEDMPKYIRMGEILREEMSGGPIRYDPAQDIDPGVEWNTPEQGVDRSFCWHCANLPGVELAMVTEFPYFGLPGEPVTQEGLVMAGRAFARAIRRY